MCQVDVKPYYSIPYLTYSRRFTHISGHLSAAGQLQDRPTFYHCATQPTNHFSGNAHSAWPSLRDWHSEYTAGIVLAGFAQDPVTKDER